jgi:SAM-dependent methyltransferase
MSWYERAFGAHYPLLYEHRNEADAWRCLETLRRLAPLGPAPVLDLACGEGRHLARLAELGTGAIGLDLSPALLAGAWRRRAETGGAWPLVRGDMRELPFRDGIFSAVLSLFTSFGYFGGLAAHLGLMREVARVLRPDGHWILDYLNCQCVAAELVGGQPRVRVREAGPLTVRESRRLAVDPPRVIKEVLIRPRRGQEVEAALLDVPSEGLRYTEEVALFHLGGIQRLAADCGLSLVASAGSYDGDPLVRDRSPRWLLVFGRAGAESGPASPGPRAGRPSA